MKVAHIDIQNFRKLKNCRVEFSKKETVFVGANNSGKTSAMDALILFLKGKQKEFTVRDFTLSNWRNIEEVTRGWIESDEPDLNPETLNPFLPSLDVWLEVSNNKIHYVSHILPSLRWSGGKLGVRMVFEPKNIEDLYKSFKAAYESARQVCGGRPNLKLWPENIYEFLEKELNKYFVIKSYVLDPVKIDEPIPQIISNMNEPIESDPFKGLFKIDVINAQRGFSDPNSDDAVNNDRRLSVQLQKYFDKHLNPTEMPEESDLNALEGLETARLDFDKKLEESFNASVGELEGLNYPGFSDPKIKISTKMDLTQGLKHDAAVQFDVRRNDEGGQGDLPLLLPEKYNGLGYQNLISMIFSLIRFRDEWMRVGKAGKLLVDNADGIEPLHLVLIEEPEAHLHAQVQQVFIKKAYDVLRNHDDLRGDSLFSTQLVISTHSSHIAHEIDFSSLRYFKRVAAKDSNEIPCADVKNLSKVFGTANETSKFVTRYLKTTHCDLFFADAAILIEGPAERMFVPHFIRNYYSELDRCYVSLLEIGGSHAHTLRPLIEILGIHTLVITDLDSIAKETTGKVLPEKGKEYRTGNSTIKTWVPQKTLLDEVLSATEAAKIKNEKVRVAYQYEIKLQYGAEEGEVTAIPYTFEDALALSNIDTFKNKTDSIGLLKKIADALNKPNIQEACEDMFIALGGNSKKAEMTLELLYTTEPSELKPPKYIEEGLEWLQNELIKHSRDYMENDGEESHE